MITETLLFTSLIVGVSGWLVLRFARAPDAAARAHEAGAHEWTFTSSYYAGPGAILVGARHARVDVYARALIVTPLAQRLVLARAGVRALAHEAEGWRGIARGPITRISTAEHGDVVLATDAATHDRLRRWLDPDDDR
jgi:hypothetical protein